MKKPLLFLSAVAIAAALAPAAQAVPHSSAQGLGHRNACAVPAEGSATCFAKVVTTPDGKTFNGAPNSAAGPAGYGSSELWSAYKLTPGTTAGAGPTIAIVDAYNAPNAAADLKVYRSTMGLPLCSDGGVSCLFSQVNQTGGSALPAADKGWAEEISLDLDMASSACPQCRILLVEATSNSFTNLFAAEDYAASQSPAAISNSYGAREFSGEQNYESHYNHPNIAVTVSSGDSGYGAEWPAASQYVVATGGTSLRTATSTRGWSESAWSGAGSGCSSYEPRPAWQATYVSGGTQCARRAIADVSSVSDPNTGVAVYDTYGDPGWMVFGGTSAAAPFIAGVYAVGGTLSGPSTTAASWPYARPGGLFDVTSGKNGRCNKTPKLCTAGSGWDGPTGLGTPNGVTAF